MSGVSSLLRGARLGGMGRTTSGQPIQFLSKSNAYFEKPDPGLAARPLQGMDMRKIISCPWVNILETRKPAKSGYQWGFWGQCQIDAFNYKDAATYFSLKNYWEEYTLAQMLKLTYPHVRYCLMFAANLLIAAGPAVLYVFYNQSFEPQEYMIDPDEYFDNYRWHYYGHDLDHHGFMQYLEARRAKKWRDPSVEPKEWIPEKYRGEWVDHEA